GSNGWFTSSVLVGLGATDNVDGSGVQSITYSASGAQAISSTTVIGSNTSFNITAEGITTITYFATDNVGNVEAAHTLTVQIDTAKPTANGSSYPDNNSSATFALWGDDATSGVAFLQSSLDGAAFETAT